MTDHFELAVSCWWSSQNERKQFAFHAAHISGSDTSRLAERCGCSDDKINDYRNSYRLYRNLYTHFEDDEVVLLWTGHELTISHWIAVAKYKLEPERALEHLCHARDNGLSERAFRAHIDQAENNIQPWIRSLKGFMPHMKALRDSYMPEIPPDKQLRVRRLLRLIERLIVLLSEEE